MRGSSPFCISLSSFLKPSDTSLGPFNAMRLFTDTASDDSSARFSLIMLEYDPNAS